jgi:hypothetical protein
MDDRRRRETALGAVGRGPIDQPLARLEIRVDVRDLRLELDRPPSQRWSMTGEEYRRCTTVRKEEAWRR